tara:strand:+ start:3177 stop:3578 length:402 start_codon:yes stop_codon:yes gene_type:complete
MKKMTVFLIVAGVVIAFVFLSKAMKKDDTIKTISAKQALVQVVKEPGVIIDVRTKDEYNAGHLTKSEFQYDVTTGEFESKISSLDKSKTYYLYCRSGNRSGKAAVIMKEKGFTNVYNIGGYSTLISAGFESSN